MTGVGGDPGPCRAGELVGLCVRPPGGAEEEPPGPEWTQLAMEGSNLPVHQGSQLSGGGLSTLCAQVTRRGSAAGGVGGMRESWVDTSTWIQGEALFVGRRQ